MLRTFSQVIAKLEESGIDYMVVGSVASMTYGEPRLTQDIDLVVELKPQDHEQLARCFETGEYYNSIANQRLPG